MKIFGIIPARFQSVRLPGKPLADIGGKSMIQRVYEQAQKAEVLSYIAVATDHKEIFSHVRSFGGNVFMTSKNHKTGTERCAETLDFIKEKAEIIVNIQGDEPFFDPENLILLSKAFSSEKVQIATLIKKTNDLKEIKSDSIIKVVCNQDQSKALYFSRLPIPFYSNKTKNEVNSDKIYYKHIGIYAFKSNVLKEIVKLPASKLEKAESLEQLRWLENDYDIFTCETQSNCFSIDTPEDLEKARNSLKTNIPEN